MKIEKIDKVGDQSILNLQREAHHFFYESMSCEINDALTSILAICESEGREALPKIKKYITKINHSLDQGKRSYASTINPSYQFNLSAALSGVLHAIRDRYKGVKMITLAPEIQLLAQGSQSSFERFFLFVFTELFCSDESAKTEVLIELRSKGQQAVITLIKDDHSIDGDLVSKINEIREESKFTGWINITPKGKGLEVIIQIPLHLRAVKINSHLI